jgi:hypothetical protein
VCHCCEQALETGYTKEEPSLSLARRMLFIVSIIAVALGCANWVARSQTTFVESKAVHLAAKEVVRQAAVAV